MKALLVLDIQNGSFAPGYSVFDKDGVITRINQLSALFRAVQYPVILIQHDGTKQGVYIPGTDAWQLEASFIQKPDDILMGKTVNDAFYKTELKSILDRNGVDTLVICGYATDFCVDTTIRSALNKDYQVIVANDGHTTFSRSFLNAEAIIRHHNVVWQNLIPTKYGVQVKTCAEIRDEIEKEDAQ